MGCDITIIEYLDQIVPNEDKDISRELSKNFKKKGINILTKSSVEKIIENDKNSTILVKTESGQKEIQADVILSAVGIEPNTKNIGLEGLKIATK